MSLTKRWLETQETTAARAAKRARRGICAAMAIAQDKDLSALDWEARLMIVRILNETLGDIDELELEATPEGEDWPDAA